MNKTALTNEFNKRLTDKMFISPNQIRKLTGFGSNKVAVLLDGLDYLSDGKGRMYFVPDVSERIAQQKCK